MSSTAPADLLEPFLAAADAAAAYLVTVPVLQL